MSVDLTVALITLLGTLSVLVWNIIDRSQSSFKERMSQATELLTGETQRRSAGIAIISASSRRLARRNQTTWRTAMILLLCTQAIYLLEQSHQDDRPDEILNLRRILELLLSFNFQSAKQDDITTMLAQRIKSGLKRFSKSSKGLGQDEVREQDELTTMLAQRIKSDLERVSKSSNGLDLDEVRKMVTQSPAIDKWVKSAKSPVQNAH